MFDSSFIQDFSVHGGAADGGGWVGVLDKLLEKTSQAMEPGGGGFELLPGLHVLGTNIHPSLVHFPIAFLSLFFALELLGSLPRRENLRQIAGPLLYFGALGAVMAAAAGLYAASIVPHGQVVHEIMEWHERLGLTVASLAVALSLWRILARHTIIGMGRALYLALATIMAGCMVFGADLGGLMVYGHGVAVQKLQGGEEAHHHESIGR